MTRDEFLFICTVLNTASLFYIANDVSKISKRMRERFPTAKEADFDWSQRDPHGHWEAHKDDKKKK